MKLNNKQIIFLKSLLQMQEDGDFNNKIRELIQRVLHNGEYDHVEKKFINGCIVRYKKYLKDPTNIILKG